MIDKRGQRRLALAVGAFLAAPAAVMAQEPPRPIDTSAFGEAGARCAELRYGDFSKTPGAIAQISDARPFAGENGAPSYCQVEGYAWRSTRFRIRFPLADWNGKMVVQGTGGMAGALPNDVPSAASSAAQLRQGYATVNHDGGHFSTITDAKWAYHDDSAAVDGGFRAPYMATVASKAVLADFYGRRPVRSYYVGCSNGGREAMMMAQHYPFEFDGIVAGAPSIAPTDLFLGMFWAAEMLRDQTRAGFDMIAARTLNAAALDQCDELDGRKDRVIDDPRKCQVDLERVRCKGRAAETCLTDRQVDIARKMYEGPRSSDGRQIAPSSAFPGSEISWVSFVTPRWAIGYAHEIFKYQAFYPAPGASFTPRLEDIDAYSRQMGSFEAIAGATNPDLTRFKAAGGKLISYYGWADAFGGAQNIMDYYDRAERVAGGEAATRDFYRNFMIPGMDHCGGGVGPSVFDFVTILDNWVEKNEAPEAITGFAVVDGKPGERRTIEAYRSGGAI
ncbi:tannase/feruloyl esterase family alpha/beta hydrolase [Brevundimonas diminuta]|uniref:tannase/feruloyl esterase family alpha/beta hydrolase n=1 Tax=Brevundimonas diminuta TaxID=293 RepID=UPI0037C88BF0